MIKAIIIDDEPLARTIVQEYLQDFTNIEVVAECNNGFEGLKAIQQHQPQLLFLDVQMPKINGFEMLELVEQPPAVIFTTAYDEYALKAFEAHAVDYLLKPFSKERFGKAVEKFLDQAGVQQLLTQTQELLQSPGLPMQAERVVVKNSGKITIIPVATIQFLEAADDYVKIYTAEGSFLKNKTMSFFEKTLPQNLFVRSHRSYIVNVQHITRIDPYEKENHIALLRSGNKVPVSHAGYAKLKAVLGL
jgi:two-component system, LytTR family, response regulator